MDFFLNVAWPWVWPTLLLLLWIGSILAGLRWLFKANSWHTVEDPVIQRAIRAAAMLLCLVGAAGWLAVVPLLSDDLDATFRRVWPWLWPSLVGIALIELTRTVDRWGIATMAPRFAAANDEVREKTVQRIVRAVSVSVLLVVLVGWSLLVPLSTEVERLVLTKVLPWLWPSTVLVIWLAVGLFVSRRILEWLQNRASETETEFDDAIVGAIKAPLWLIVITAGFALWAGLVPLPKVLEGYIDAIAKGAGVFLLIMFTDAFIQTWMTARASTSKVLRTSGGVLRSAAKALIYILGILMVLSTVGIDITPLIASLGVGSIAVGLALQKTMEDFLAGLILAADQPLRVGDFVTLEPGLEGIVLSIGWRSTQIRTRDDMHVIVPNSKLAGATLVNRSMPSRLATFTIPVGIAYGTDLARASQVAVEVATQLQQEHPAGVRDYEPRAVFGSFADSSVNFNTWLRATDWERHFGLKSAFIVALHARFEAENIVIPFPMRTLDVPPGTELSVKRNE